MRCDIHIIIMPCSQQSAVPYVLAQISNASSQLWRSLPPKEKENQPQQWIQARLCAQLFTASWQPSLAMCYYKVLQSSVALLHSHSAQSALISQHCFETVSNLCHNLQKVLLPGCLCIVYSVCKKLYNSTGWWVQQHMSWYFPWFGTAVLLLLFKIYWGSLSGSLDT